MKVWRVVEWPLLFTAPVIGIAIAKYLDAITDEQTVNFLLTYFATVGGVGLAFGLNTAWDIKKMKVKFGELKRAYLQELVNNNECLGESNVWGISFEVFKAVTMDSDFLADIDKQTLNVMYKVTSRLRRSVGSTKAGRGIISIEIDAFLKSEEYKEMQNLIEIFSK